MGIEKSAGKYIDGYYNQLLLLELTATDDAERGFKYRKHKTDR